MPQKIDDVALPNDNTPYVDRPVYAPLSSGPVNKKILGLATLSGVLYFLGFVGFDQWYLEWIAFVPLLVALESISTGRAAFFTSWWMGLVTHLGGYYWIVHLLMEFGDLPLPLAIGGYVLLCVLQSGVLAVFGYLTWKVRQRTGIAIGWIAPVTLMAAEFAYPLLFDSYTANSQAFMPVVIQIADLGGVLLVSALIALVNGAIAEVVLARIEDERKFPVTICAVAAASLAVTLAYGAWRMNAIDARDAAAPKLKVALIQANVGAKDKHINPQEGIEKYRVMTDIALETPGLGLAIWPESGYNDFVRVNQNLTGKVASRVTVPMLVGVVRTDLGPESTQAHYWNSIVAVQPGGQVVANYDKIKLLMLGESLPAYDLLQGFYQWLLKQGILPYISAFDHGRSYAPLPVGPYRLSADVCYEDILPRHIRDLMGPIDAQGTRPHAMVNGTNDSWYGPVEPRIHLALSVFRAVEHRRWLIRSTATGISAFIDSSGRIVERSPFEQAVTLTRDVPMIEAGPTVYGQVGDVLGWAALVSVLAALVVRKVRR
jgi:apolipoprotein N-acyltransferase